MSCREFAEFIAEYLSNELPHDIRAQFEHHLAICMNCVNYLHGYAAAVALGKAAFESSEEPVPADIPTDLIKAILDARR